jgi:RNA polymerase sigma-70 factor (ECF subfamily)
MSRQEKKQDFSDVVDAHYERIFRGALAVTRDRYLAEEIVQETFLSALKKFDGFSGRSSVFTWLYRIMLNNYCKHCRRKKLRRRLGFVRAKDNSSTMRNAAVRDSSPAAELAGFEERKLLMEAVDGLPARHRMVVAMYYFDDHSLNEIAEILNCHLGTVKSRLFNARKRLCQTLQRKLREGHENAMPKS